MTGLVPLQEERGELPDPLSALGGNSKEVAVCKPGRGPSPGTRSATVKNKCWLFKPPSPRCFVMAARADLGSRLSPETTGC